MPRMNGTSAGARSDAATITVNYDVDSKHAEALIAKLDNMLSPQMLALFLSGPVVEHFQAKFDSFFESQGTSEGQWEPLAESTIEDRIEKGFGPGPINQRTGELRGFVTESPGNVRVLNTLAVLTYPGPLPTGELGQKVKTAQQGRKFTGHFVLARPVMEADESDLLYMMSALNFFIEAGVQ